ncbi:DNA methyltransferase [Janibacter sp. G368]|uniref:DNA methyltransferase n=1 Tax=Janibacter sp. G368 TaxID=3420441 RepID=UPI003D011F02
MTTPRRSLAYTLDNDDVLTSYGAWAAPDLILSDGAYGVSGFPGDPHTPAVLDEWYAPHVAAWSAAAKPGTSLWFWNTEVGWANVHPLLVAHGWQFEVCHTWDKGIGQVAGNVNSKTIRRFPVVTEVCVMYSRKFAPTDAAGNALAANEWMRAEWRRAGLPLSRANEACGVKNAATRKWFTLDRHWYFPPGEAMAQLAAYATEHGPQTDRPYFSLDGKTPLTAEEWDALRYPWTHEHGLTNVWSTPSLRGKERLKSAGNAAAHLNQKPLDLMRRIIKAATRPGDVVWEPFGGLCSASVAAVELGRRPYAAERLDEFHSLAIKRLNEAVDARETSGAA